MSILPKEIIRMRGKEFAFQGQLFASGYAEPQFKAMVHDVRKSSATIRDLKNPHKRHPAVEFLIINPRCQQRRWTRPFPVNAENSDFIDTPIDDGLTFNPVISDPGDEDESIVIN